MGSNLNDDLSLGLGSFLIIIFFLILWSLTRERGENQSNDFGIRSFVFTEKMESKGKWRARISVINGLTIRRES